MADYGVLAFSLMTDIRISTLRHRYRSGRIADNGMDWRQDAIQRLQQYAMVRGLTLHERLVQSYEGVVVSTGHATALKSFSFYRLYRGEPDVC